METGSVETTIVPSVYENAEPFAHLTLRASQRQLLRRRARADLDAAETSRANGHANYDEHHAKTRDALAALAARAKAETAEAAAFLQTRSDADAAYAAAVLKQRLGGRTVAELADLSTGRLGRRGGGGAAAGGGAGTSGLPALEDAAGCAEVRAAVSVLGCMMAQGAEKLSRFGESRLAKDVHAAHDAYAAAVDTAIASYGSAVVGEPRKLDTACAEAFAQLQARFAAAEAAETAGEDAPADLWMGEFGYGAAVAKYGGCVWSARRTARKLLEAIRAAEVARTSALSAALRAYAGLAQRVWADVSASSASVHSLCARGPSTTGLSERPTALALENLLEKAGGGAGTAAEYASASKRGASTLVVHEGLLSYQRAMLRTWVPAYVVLTADSHMHAFSAPAAGSSAELRPEQHGFSLRLAAEPPPVAKPAAGNGVFEVASLAAGFLGKVGLRGASVSATAFRARDEAEAALWMDAVRRALRGDVEPCVHPATSAAHATEVLAPTAAAGLATNADEVAESGDESGGEATFDLFGEPDEEAGGEATVDLFSEPEDEAAGSDAERGPGASRSESDDGGVSDSSQGDGSALAAEGEPTFGLEFGTPGKAEGGGEPPSGGDSDGRDA